MHFLAVVLSAMVPSAALPASSRPPQRSHAVEVAGETATVFLMRNTNERSARCPAGVLQFGLDERDDAEWTRSNLHGWDEAAILRVVAEALSRSHDALPGRLPDFCIGISARPTSIVLELMQGIAGAAIAEDLVVLYLAPAINPGILDVLPFTVAHEYHHTVTWGSSPSGLDALVREGRAHHFAWTLYPERLHPSARALEPEEVEPAWARIRAALDEPARTFTPGYMFGGPRNGNLVPGWAGYTVGFCLVRDYAERDPDRTLVDLARIPAREFLVATPRCPGPR